MQPIISNEQRASLAELLRPERWIARTKGQVVSPAPSRPSRLPHRRIFCFPYAGGGASIYREWTLSDDIEICPVQLPGRETRLKEPAFTRLSSLVRVLAHVLHPMMDVPFAFFGYSMGALISFELARYLRQAQMPEPNQLFVAAHRAPQLPDRRAPLHHLPDAALLDRLVQLGGTPQEILQQTELMNILLPVIRADFALCETYSYVPDAPLRYPITAFGGMEDTMVSEQELRAWDEQTTNTCRLHMLPGDHFFLRNNRQALLDTMKNF